VDNLRMAASDSARITAHPTTKSPDTPARHVFVRLLCRRAPIFIVPIPRISIGSKSLQPRCTYRLRVSLKV